MFGIQSNEEHANEIKLFDEAFANNCKQVKTIGIELIDKFLGQRNDFVTNLKQAFHLMAKSTDDDSTENRAHVDALSDNFEMAVDNIWYTLIELESSLHERIMDSTKLFNHTVRTIIENFNDKSNETFRSIRSASDAYFQSNSDDLDNGITRQRHLTIINQKLDIMCNKANKWLIEVTEKYKL